MTAQNCISRIKIVDRKVGEVLETHSFEFVETRWSPEEHTNRYTFCCSTCGIKIDLYPDLTYTAEEVYFRFYEFDDKRTPKVLTCSETAIKSVIE